MGFFHLQAGFWSLLWALLVDLWACLSHICCWIWASLYHRPVFDWMLGLGFVFWSLIWSSCFLFLICRPWSLLFVCWLELLSFSLLLSFCLVFLSCSLFLYLLLMLSIYRGVMFICLLIIRDIRRFFWRLIKILHHETDIVHGYSCPSACSAGLSYWITPSALSVRRTIAVVLAKVVVLI